MDLIHPGEPGFVDRRRIRRAGTRIEATVRMRGRFAVAATTADLSPAGARVEGAGPFPAGSEMWMRLPGLESQTARVAWSRPGATGIAFAQPLHPAVYARFLPADARLRLVDEPAVPAQMPAEIHALPRREQILRGYGAVVDGPLSTVKEPKGTGLFGSIRRSAQRHVEHRCEERFADALRTGPMRLTIEASEAEVRDVSASGLRVASRLEPEIGTELAVDFEGCDPIPGRVVWRRDGELGLSLPDEALALDDA